MQVRYYALKNTVTLKIENEFVSLDEKGKFFKESQPAYDKFLNKKNFPNPIIGKEVITGEMPKPTKPKPTPAPAPVVKEVKAEVKTEGKIEEPPSEKNESKETVKDIFSKAKEKKSEEKKENKEEVKEDDKKS